jgi:prepilin-type N-terminal cleavage/methylation domain-containing protein
VASKANPGAQRSRDKGFNLVELLIVITIMGTLVAVVSSAIIVALRTTPAAEARVEDARGVQGLVTWLPQDVDAAAPSGFNRDPNDVWPCAGSKPANSYNVLSIRWTESAATTTDYAASYRYENNGTGWTVARYYCVGAGPASRSSLTSDLPTPWDPNPLADPLAQPAYTLMCSSVVDDTYDGNCPVVNRHPPSALAPSPVLSLKLMLDLGNGNEIMIDAAPKNPDQSLADDPDATANQPPTVSTPVISLELARNTTEVFDLAPYFGAVNDPDGEETALTVSVDPTELLPENLLTATTAYTATTQFELTLTANSTSGTATNPLWLIVSDERGGWTVVQATITVSDPPNVAPTAPTTGDHVTIGLPANPGATTALDLTTLFAIEDDAPLDELRATVTLAEPGAPPADATQFSVVAVPDSSQIDVWFGPDIALSVNTFIEIYAEVADAESAALPLQLTIEVLPSNTNTAPTASPLDVPIDLEAGANTTLDLGVSHGVSDTDAGDVLAATVQSTPVGVTATVSGLSVTVTAEASAPVGPLPTPVTVRVTDLQGAFVDVTVTITVTEPPPPVPDCVLGSLSAAPNPISRQGSGSGSAKKLSADVTVTLTYSGTCDGLRLNYDSGDPSGLGAGVGRVFPPGSPSSIVIVGHHNGGTEQFTPGSHVLTASTSSAVTPDSIATTLAVT